MGEGSRLWCFCLRGAHMWRLLKQQSFSRKTFSRSFGCENAGDLGLAGRNQDTVATGPHKDGSVGLGS
jgi:hypothetical protein